MTCRHFGHLKKFLFLVTAAIIDGGWVYKIVLKGYHTTPVHYFAGIVY